MKKNKKPDKKPRFEKKGTKKDYKTDTILNRVIQVYLPSIEMKKQWEDMSGQSKTSTSKFIIEHVNNSLQQEQNKEGYSSRAELLDDMKKIQDENKELYKKIKMYESLVMKLEEENRGYRIKPFFEKDYIGEFEADLVTLFRTRSEVRKQEVYEHLGINPQDTEKTKGIRKQIEILERYGLLKDIGGKWRWKG
jgi:hypothetical protein